MNETNPTWLGLAWSLAAVGLLSNTTKHHSNTDDDAAVEHDQKSLQETRHRNF